MFAKFLLLLFLNWIQLTLQFSNNSADYYNFNLRVREKEIIDNILDGYDPRILPNAVGENKIISGEKDSSTNNASVQIFVRYMEIDDLKMEIKVQLIFRQVWKDERLKYNDSDGRIRLITLTDPKLIWTPDVYFTNEKEGFFHDILKPNTYLRIFKAGNVLYSRRISLTLSCPMNFKHYPFDSQICTMQMETYSSAISDLTYLWKEGDPVQVVKNLYFPHFTLQKFGSGYCDSLLPFGSLGKRSCVKVDFLIHREIGHYLLEIYISSVILVMISWLSFWIDVEAVFVRILLGVSMLCTALFQVSEISRYAPETSYTKAIDIWTGVCLMFIFVALLETVILHYLPHKGKEYKQNSPNEAQDYSQLVDVSSSKSESNGSLPLNIENDCHNVKTVKTVSIKEKLSKLSMTTRIDVIARMGYPVLLAVFAITYFLYYTSNDVNISNEFNNNLLVVDYNFNWKPN